MARYNNSIKERIAGLIRADSFTVAEICKSVDISKDTYYRWLKEKPDFSDAIKKAREDYEAGILVKCEKSLEKLISGFTYEEIKTVKVGEKVREETVTTKLVLPNLGAIIHYQTNRNPEKWKNRQSISVKDETSKLIDQLNEEQLNEVINRLLNDVSLERK